ncbi:concanavalin A-like lectin/glucanase [Xylariaceae sp. FL1019]|nr:concanavalin A-like lectin/glucanase [Xylariaceae sp. FL1019]
MTTALCDPTKTDCLPDRALGMTLDLNFLEKFVADDSPFYLYPGADWTEDGITLTIQNETDIPVIVFPRYLFFGRLDLVMHAAPGTGIATVVALVSDDNDEIDWEFVGADLNHVQSNYIGKGDPFTPDRTKYHDASNITTAWHQYSIDWTPQSISWLVDGVTMRTLTYTEAKMGTLYPSVETTSSRSIASSKASRRQTPMQCKIYSYVVGKHNASEQDLQWGHGYADLSLAPFTSYIEAARFQDYMNGETSAKEYEYTDMSGSFEAISIIPNPSTIIASSYAPTSTNPNVQTSKPAVDSKHNLNKLNPGAIVGVAVGAVALIVLGILLFFLIRRRKTAKNRP